MAELLPLVRPRFLLDNPLVNLIRFGYHLGMQYLVLLRHGQSQWNQENRFTGWIDVDLSPLGEQEAIQAGHALKGYRFDRVYTSTLKRAIKTADLVLQATDSNAHLITSGGIFAKTCSDALRERDYGNLTGLNKIETALKYGDDQVHRWRRGYHDTPPGGESLADVVDRVQAYYHSDIEPHLMNGESILITAHGNSLRALLVILGLKNTQDIQSFDLATGKPLILRIKDGKPS